MSRYNAFSPRKVNHRGKTVSDLSTSLGWGNAFKSFTNRNLTAYVISAGEKGRVDLISYKFYGTTDYVWAICAVNHITDPFEQVTPGRRILIPSL